MITKTQLEGFNKSRKIFEKNLSAIQRTHLKYSLKLEDVERLEDWMQSITMITNGVASKTFEEDVLNSIRIHCDEKVFQMFQDAIKQKRMEVVTNYPERRSILKKIQNLFSNEK